MLCCRHEEVKDDEKKIKVYHDPKYRMDDWQRLANRKSVLTLCVLCAAAAVAVNLTELFVAPQILSKVEQAAPVAELIGTILLFTVLLFLAKGLKSYLALNTLYGRVEVRTGLINQVEYKNNTTSYSNTLDPERIKSIRVLPMRCQATQNPASTSGKR